jgi:uncharacterized protein YndB with AHSA1/START domain
MMEEIIHLSMHLPCSPRHAFEMFTKKSFLESWLAPLAETEPWVGGRYELFWEPDDRENNSTLGCQITAIVPDQFLSFDWRSPKQFKHFANNVDPLTHVVVFFIPSHERTNVHLIHSGWRSSAEWKEAREWQSQAWQLAFQALEKQIIKEKSLSAGVS